MQRNFPASLENVLAHEGGFVNHPADPGGATNKGVTQHVYSAYLRNKGWSVVDVRHISDQEVADIYREQYWNVVRGDEMPAGLDYALFDYAVNSGPNKAAKDLQRVLGVPVDGVVGQVTLSAAHRASAPVTIRTLCDRRMAFLLTLKHWKTFGKGWSRRVREVRDDALEMLASKAPPLPPTKPSPQPKADPKDVAVSKTPEGAGGAAIGVGGAGTVIVETAEKLSPFAKYSEILQWVFVALLLVGAGVILWSVLKKRREGGLA